MKVVDAFRRSNFATLRQIAAICDSHAGPLTRINDVCAFTVSMCQIVNIRGVFPMFRSDRGVNINHGHVARILSRLASLALVLNGGNDSTRRGYDADSYLRAQRDRAFYFIL